MKYLNKDIENWRPPNEEGGDDDDKEQGLAGFKKFVKEKGIDDEIADPDNIKKWAEAHLIDRQIEFIKTFLTKHNKNVSVYGFQELDGEQAAEKVAAILGNEWKMAVSSKKGKEDAVAVFVRTTLGDLTEVYLNCINDEKGNNK